jgi:hypothetical protein
LLERLSTLSHFKSPRQNIQVVGTPFFAKTNTVAALSVHHPSFGCCNLTFSPIKRISGIQLPFDKKKDTSRILSHRYRFDFRLSDAILERIAEKNFSISLNYIVV